MKFLKENKVEVFNYYLIILIDMPYFLFFLLTIFRIGWNHREFFNKNITKWGLLNKLKIYRD